MNTAEAKLGKLYNPCPICSLLIGCLLKRGEVLLRPARRRVGVARPRRDRRQVKTSAKAMGHSLIAVNASVTFSTIPSSPFFITSLMMEPARLATHTEDATRRSTNGAEEAIILETLSLSNRPQPTLCCGSRQDLFTAVTDNSRQLS